MSTHPLLFVKDLPEPGPDGRRRVFWAPPCAGLDYVAACDFGEDLALDAIQYMRAQDLAPLLGWSVIDMPAWADLDDAGKGVMVGFLSVFARLAMAAATPERLLAVERRHAAWQAYWRELVEVEDEDPAD
jgi:hypothetical protein